MIKKNWDVSAAALLYCVYVATFAGVADLCGGTLEEAVASSGIQKDASRVQKAQERELPAWKKFGVFSFVDLHAPAKAGVDSQGPFMERD